MEHTISGKEIKKCAAAMLVLNIMAWILFHILDAIAEFVFDTGGILDWGFYSIPCILTVIYFIVERKLFDAVRFKAKFNFLMAVFFVIIVVIFGGIAWLFCGMLDIFLIPQPSHSEFINLNGIEYLIFPFMYGIVSLLLGFVIKLISYLVYRRKKV